MNVEFLEDLSISTRENSLGIFSHVKKRNVPAIDEKAIIEDLKMKLFYDIESNSITKFTKHIEEAESIEKKWNNGIKKKILRSAFPDNNTLLHFVAFYDTYEIGELLLKNGADIDAMNTKKWTPLIVALIRDNIKVGNLLVCNGATTAIGLINLDINRKIFPGMSMSSQKIFILSSYINFLIQSECLSDIRRFYNSHCLDMEKKFVIFKEGRNSEYCKAYSIGSSIDNVEHIKYITPALLSSSQNSYEDNYINIPTSSATRPSFFINNLINWIVHSSANAIVSTFHSIAGSPFPSTHQQTVDYADKSFSQDNVSGAVQLIDLAIRKYTREKYSGLSNETPLTKEQILESKITSAESNLEIAQGKYGKMNQCPKSSLHDTQISEVKICEKYL